MCEPHSSTEPREHTVRKKIVAILSALLVVGIVGAASAATLGGLNSENLGADTTVVASCDNDGIDLGYTSAFSAGEYAVSAVVLSDVDAACAGQDVEVTLVDGAGASVGQVAAVAGGAGTVTLTLTAPVAARLVEGAAAVISG